MGDRANIRFVEEGGSTMYFYTHWDGTELWKTLQEALERGKDRWDDESYLARIIFSEMIADDIKDNTGFGLSTQMGDNGWNVLEVNMTEKSVKLEDESWSFEDYIKLEKDPRIEDEEEE